MRNCFRLPHVLKRSAAVGGCILNPAVLICIGVLVATCWESAAAPASVTRQVINLDRGWRFLKAEATGAEKPDFDDSTWREVDVPHDWSIEGPFSKTNKTGGAGAFLPAGIGWYRKEFTLPATDSDRRVLVDFDGVMANSDVWINGHHLGHRPYGYVSFIYELNPYLNYGDKPNVLAVRADNSKQPASRWYAGAGIYRHVRLIATDPVHLEPWSTFVTTPEIKAESATVRVQSTVTNETSSANEIKLHISIIGPDGETVASGETDSKIVAPGAEVQFNHDLPVRQPRRWDLDNPVLYHAVVQVRPVSNDTDKVLDDETVPFGIRELHFAADTGFWLNGKNFKIKGVCLHEDGGAFGSAIPLGVWRQRLTELRKLGVNAIRTAHNPPAPDFLDLCDQMGFLVMDEFFDCWTVGKNPYDYHLYFKDWSKTDARDSIRRDRNHPSIILYSVGNEIHDTPHEKLAYGILKGLVEVCHETDPTRPVTQALFRPNVSHDYDNGLADLLDVIGTNYRDLELLAAHQAKPTRKIIGTEQGQDRRTWLNCRDHPEHAGQFLWTGIDYLGEARQWPRIGFGSGLLDRTGLPRALGFQRQSWWSDKPMVYAVRRVAPNELAPTDPGYETNDLRRPHVLFDDWSPHNREPHKENVEVYSNCQEVELLLNGKSLGSKSLPEDASPRNWQVPFEPGTLKAIGKNAGKEVATFELCTWGKPARIELTAIPDGITPNWNDVVFVRAIVVDENGIPVATARDLVSFKTSGPGVVAAVDNGSNSSQESFQATERQTYLGRCSAMVKATGKSGEITVTASAPGLEPGLATIHCQSSSAAE